MHQWNSCCWGTLRISSIGHCCQTVAMLCVVAAYPWPIVFTHTLMLHSYFLLHILIEHCSLHVMALLSKYMTLKSTIMISYLWQHAAYAMKRKKKNNPKTTSMLTMGLTSNGNSCIFNGLSYTSSRETMAGNGPAVCSPCEVC